VLAEGQMTICMYVSLEAASFVSFFKVPFIASARLKCNSFYILNCFKESSSPLVFSIFTSNSSSHILQVSLLGSLNPMLNCKQNILLYLS
jgi:hypothetical protein